MPYLSQPLHQLPSTPVRGGLGIALLHHRCSLSRCSLRRLRPTCPWRPEHCTGLVCFSRRKGCKHQKLHKRKVFVSPSWSRLLTCLDKPRDGYKSQVRDQPTTMKELGGILGHTKFTSSKRWRSQGKSHNWKNACFTPVLFTKK